MKQENKETAEKQQKPRSIGKQRKLEQYQDMIARLYPELTVEDGKKDKILSRTVTLQVTDACSLACKYCYQIQKGHRRMSFETAKEFLDLLISGERGFSGYITPETSPGIILEFIGGEPFLEVGLIDQAVDYFKQELAEQMHPWATKYCISICSNGVAYFDPEVQRFLQKNKDHLSLSITIDGNQELHDSCRVFPDGVTGSYAIASAAARDWMDRGNYMGSKITIAPENLPYLYDAVMHMVEFGYQDINANCVYEKGWEPEHAAEFYRQLKHLADELLKSGRARDISCSLFCENFFRPKAADDLETWCGGTGLMLACDPDGYLYPCIRYMESSLGSEREPLRIGDLKHGLGRRRCDKDCIACLQAVDRRTQSTDECFYCPIAEGCSYCSAYNYQIFGTPDSRATYICRMHQARALANVYYWNRYYEIYGEPKWFPMYCPKEWALQIISEEEYQMLTELADNRKKRAESSKENKNEGNYCNPEIGKDRKEQQL